MSKVPINYYFKIPRAPSGSASTVATPKPHPSVTSSTGEDGGTVEGLARLAMGGMKRHSSISQLINNLKDQRSGTIVGHGSPGMFEVGDGPLWTSSEGHISLYNEEHWHEKIKTMWRKEEIWGKQYFYSPINILACSVAGDENGIRLLQKMADLTNRKFVAYTGLIYYEYDSKTKKGIRYLFEKGHKFVEIYPTGAIVINRSKSFIDNETKSPYLNNKKAYQYDEKLLTKGVSTIKIRLLNKSIYVEQIFSGELVKVILDILLFTAPFLKSGVAVGIITAQVFINYSNNTSQIFNVHSDRLAESTSNGETFLTSPNFRKTLNTLFNIQ